MKSFLMSMFKLICVIALCALQQARACTRSPSSVEVTSALVCRSTSITDSDLCVVSWYKNGELICGQTDRILSHDNLPSDEGSYMCGVEGVNSTSINFTVRPRDVSKSQADMQQTATVQFFELGELTKQTEFRGKVKFGDSFSCIFNHTLDSVVFDRLCEMELFSAVDIFKVGDILALHLTRNVAAVSSGRVIVNMIVFPLFNRYTASVDLTLLPLPTPPPPPTTPPPTPPPTTLLVPTPSQCNGPNTIFELTVTLDFTSEADCDEQNTGMLVSGIEEVLSHWPCLRVSNSDLKCDSPQELHVVLQLTAEEVLNFKQIKTALRSREVIRGVRIINVDSTVPHPILSRVEIICTVGFLILVLIGVICFCIFVRNCKQRTGPRDVRPALRPDVTKRRTNTYAEVFPLQPLPGPDTCIVQLGTSCDQQSTTDGSNESINETHSSHGFLARPISLPPV